MVEDILRIGVDAFQVVGEEAAAEIGVPHAKAAKHVHLPCDVHQRPVAALGARHHPDTKAWCHCAAVTVFCPVDGERIEIVVLEVHHRVELVHESFAHPRLGVLTYGRTCIPAPRLVACQVVVLADG